MMEEWKYYAEHNTYLELATIPGTLKGISNYSNRAFRILNCVYVTGFDKTQLTRTKTEINFIA